MKLLVISDVHGNQAALDAVLAVPHDRVVCLGDIVGYGPEPRACMTRLLAEDAVIVRGNHDHALAFDADPRCSAGFRWLAEATSTIGRTQIQGGDLARLGAAPRYAFIDVDEMPAFCVHATPRDSMYRYLRPADRDAWRHETFGCGASLFLVGHSHIQFQLAIDGRRIVNPGSVGQPKDGDPRAAYALLEDGRIEFGRASYDVEQTVHALQASDVDPAAVEALAALLRTGHAPDAAA